MAKGVIEMSISQSELDIIYEMLGKDSRAQSEPASKRLNEYEMLTEIVKAERRDKGITGFHELRDMFNIMMMSRDAMLSGIAQDGLRHIDKNPDAMIRYIMTGYVALMLPNDMKQAFKALLNDLNFRVAKGHKPNTTEQFFIRALAEYQIVMEEALDGK